MQKQFVGFDHGIHEITWLDRDVWLIIQPWGELVVAKFGAQILHYKPEHHQAVFWLNWNPVSLNAAKLKTNDEQDNHLSLDDLKPVRGGVPLCWPWFGAHSKDATKPNHGVARSSMWQLSSGHLASLTTEQSEFTFKPLDPIFSGLALEFQLIVSENKLQMKLLTKNISTQAQQLTQAIHSYFLVGDSQQVVLKGLKDCKYFDKLDKNKVKLQVQDLKNIEAIDNIYQHSDQVTIVDSILKRDILISKKYSGSTIVWNPGEVAKKIDILDGSNFICVEAGNTAHENLTILPDECVELVQQIELK